MPKPTSYEPGTPSWVDVGTDLAVAKPFYEQLFGWESEEAAPGDEAGGYGFFTMDGSKVAGFGPQMNPGPPFWASYITVADADETAAKVEAAGGTVVVPPMDVFTAGRMAVFQDTEGAFFSVWQPIDDIGATLVNEPGAFCWTELASRDLPKATAFYPAVFGWGFESHEGGPMPYTEWKLGERSIAGALPMPDMVPAEVPTHWLVYFAVEDTDAAVAKVSELGGGLVNGPIDTPAGRLAVMTDPLGCVFAVIKNEMH